MIPDSPGSPSWVFPQWMWGYWIPIGLLLLIWGGLSTRKARRVAPLAALSIALGTLSYWATGFAFHLGGAQAVSPDAPGLGGLNALFSLIPESSSWGLFGLTGFFLMGPELTTEAVGLFLEYLPVMMSAILVLGLALSERRRWMIALAGGLMGAAVLPVASCWMWGGGWLARTGETLGLGHGLVDFGGTVPVLWLPGMMALGLLAVQPKPERSRTPEPPQTYGPMLANVGALMIGMGWMGWSLSRPFHLSGARLDWNLAALNVALGMAGAVLTSQLYSWLVLGAPGALLAAQGLAAGWGAVMAGAPFIPSWAALVLGLISGLLFPILRYGLHRWLRHSSGAATIALALTGGLGVVGTGLLADGRWGQGVNGIGTYVAGETTGFGVAGLFARGDTQQLVAQLVGMAAVGLWGLLWGGILGLLTRTQSIWIGVKTIGSKTRRRPGLLRSEVSDNAEEARGETGAETDDESETEPEIGSEPSSGTLDDDALGDITSDDDAESSESLATRLSASDEDKESDSQEVIDKVESKSMGRS